ncbi:MAG: bifunctional diaminohydroxyphosphoribosylaminopyrimidine deaminase/5-amino-6-(5-phosphoribosylamino)uracil reductase RibD [Hydrogenibacillus schlegelii]|uniref:Riboflavin biosynthesis protein RibD n=1 Tax=Hydrogenibacillus schlegelii TaxID=1484 RepID=A0A947D136_HYDSH|nr:bifunctional diaminohydroxyphosphoribosylaminopyrimidine deaminase/5-amino-6-(5-phosphoribosylamino)uracil reductase RibD [Hydrogenibacillus schlegelii]
MSDERWMALALELARGTRGQTHPNPRVGAVIVRDGRVVGLGAHLRPGEAHAEVQALRMAGEAARGATMYVTLEPCNHTGRTPPCTEAIIAAGLKRVVVAMEDPDPRVRGAGIARLQAAGLEVDVGLFRETAEAINAPYLTGQALGRPYVWLKLAMTLDGRIAAADGRSRWITGEASRRRVHELRSEADAVLVGSGTVLADDPDLSPRLPGARPPLKVVLDGRLRTPPEARLFSRGEVLIVTTPEADEAKKAALRARGAEIVTGPRNVAFALQVLFERGIRLVLVEGGATVAGAFWAARAIDRVSLFVAPKILGAGLPTLAGPPVPLEAAVPLEALEVERLGDDLVITGRPRFMQASSDRTEEAARRRL